jgi:hypothetical protein
MKELKVLALVFMVSAFSFSQSINVTFQVDMSMQVFDGNFPAGANVVVRGSFQADFGDPGGNWQGNLYQLSDPDDDTVYTGTFNAPVSLVGNNYAFKYVIVNPPAGDNWESISERQFTLTSPATILPVVWFNNDYFIYDTLVTNTINFTADISSILGVGMGGAFDPNQDSLLVMGLDWYYLGQNVTGSRRMINTDPFNPGIYTTTLSVTSTAGILENYNWNDSTNWKFKAYPDSRFQNSGWETGPDRWHVYQADGTIISLPTIFPAIIPRPDTLSRDVDLTIKLIFDQAFNKYNGEPIPMDSIVNVIITGTDTIVGTYSIAPPPPPYPCYCIEDTAYGYIKLLTKTSENMWTFHTVIKAGTNSGIIEFQFGVAYPGYDTINGGNANILNEPNEYGTYNILVISDVLDSINYYARFGGWPPIGVERIENLLPSDFQLEQNYPNPFNPSTKIRYSITEYSLVTLKVFTLLGEEIETLVNSEQGTGVYEATFDASNLSSGIYFYTLKTESFSSSKKMILIK